MQHRIKASMKEKRQASGKEGEPKQQQFRGTVLRTKYVIKIMNTTPSLSNSPSAYFTCNGLDA